MSTGALITEYPPYENSDPQKGLQGCSCLWCFVSALRCPSGHLEGDQWETQVRIIKYGQHISKAQPQYCLHCQADVNSSSLFFISLSSSVFAVFDLIFFFFLAVFHFEKHSIPQTTRKKARPVKILESFLLPLRSIQKTNFCFFISPYLSTCKLSDGAASLYDLLFVPFPCHIAHKPIPTSFCSRKSLDAKPKKWR